MDEESALYYAGARYYDPVLGNWPAVDPLEDAFPSHSPYNYVLNNPLVLVDPSGACPEGYEKGEVWNGLLCFGDGSVVEAERDDEPFAGFGFAEIDENDDGEPEGKTFFFDASTEEGRNALYNALVNSPSLACDMVGAEPFSYQARRAAMKACIHGGQKAFRSHPLWMGIEAIVFGGARILNPRTPVVIGRQMTKWVVPQTRGLGATYLQFPRILRFSANPSGLEIGVKSIAGFFYNVSWIAGKKYGGRRVIDVGVKPGTSLPSSSFFTMERAVTALPGGTLSPGVVPYYLQRSFE